MAAIGNGKPSFLNPARHPPPAQEGRFHRSSVHHHSSKAPSPRAARNAYSGHGKWPSRRPTNTIRRKSRIEWIREILPMPRPTWHRRPRPQLIEQDECRHKSSAPLVWAAERYPRLRGLFAHAGGKARPMRQTARLAPPGHHAARRIDENSRFTHGRHAKWMGRPRYLCPTYELGESETTVALRGGRLWCPRWRQSPASCWNIARTGGERVTKLWSAGSTTGPIVRPHRCAQHSR